MADIDRHSGMEKLRDMPQGSPEDVKMLGLFMDVGAMMIRNGSEVKRVEDTLRRWELLMEQSVWTYLLLHPLWYVP